MAFPATRIPRATMVLMLLFFTALAAACLGGCAPSRYVPEENAVRMPDASRLRVPEGFVFQNERRLLVGEEHQMLRSTFVKPGKAVLAVVEMDFDGSPLLLRAQTPNLERGECAKGQPCTRWRSFIDATYFPICALTAQYLIPQPNGASVIVEYSELATGRADYCDVDLVKGLTPYQEWVYDKFKETGQEVLAELFEPGQDADQDK